MAMQVVRLRRALTTLSTLHRSLLGGTPTPSVPATARTIERRTIQSPQQASLFQTRGFGGSRSLEKERHLKLYKEGDEITEDTILFEGCDYNHWLITMDFPKDPKPSPEEMVAAYERTCAQGLNISIEEAKKRIYACSTTTYQGFQAVMSEEESRLFENIPGVVFVLPDSYIDPQNKEYGGDKYENGVITPRPPPVHYQRGGRSRQPRFDRQEVPMTSQHRSPQYGQQGQMHGGGVNFRPSQNYPSQQNYGPPGQGERIPTSNARYVPEGRGYGARESYSQQQNYSPGPGMWNPAGNRDYAPGTGGNYPANGSPMPPYQTNYNQGQQGNLHPQDQTGFQMDWGNSSPHTQTYQQNADYGQSHGQGGQRFSPSENWNTQGKQHNGIPAGQTGTDHRRY